MHPKIVFMFMYVIVMSSLQEETAGRGAAALHTKQSPPYPVHNTLQQSITVKQRQGQRSSACTLPRALLVWDLTTVEELIVIWGVTLRAD